MTSPMTLPPLPDQKTKGWEFTDISALDFDAYEATEAVPIIAGGSEATVLDLAEATDARPDLAEALGTLVPGDDPFVARNEAGQRNGVLVHVPAGARLSEPIQIEVPVHADGTVVNWRTLIVLEE